MGKGVNTGYIFRIRDGTQLYDIHFQKLYRGSENKKTATLLLRFLSVEKMGVEPHLFNPRGCWVLYKFGWMCHDFATNLTCLTC